VTGAALVVQGDALHLPLPDGSVDLIVSSPPYWSLRAYSAGPGEIGSEPTPAEYLEALWAATAEMMRVLKPTGSIFINLGDKYSGDQVARSGSSDAASLRPHDRISRRSAPASSTPGFRPKSLLGLPWAYALGCTGMLASLTKGMVPIEMLERTFRPHMTELDIAAAFQAVRDVGALGGPDPGLNLILRAPIVLHKVNSLPESVRDRVRTSDQEMLFHFVKQPRYYSAVDEIREPQVKPVANRDWGYENKSGNGTTHRSFNANQSLNPLGKLPGSVWSMASEPLNLPGYFVTRDGTLVDFIAPTRGRPRPRTSNGHGLFDPDAYAQLIAGEDAGAWRWVRSTGINASPWPKAPDGLQLHTAASHYAAFPSRWPEQLIKGFSPPGICLECGQGRVPVVEREQVKSPVHGAGSIMGNRDGGPDERGWDGLPRFNMAATILGYACLCTPFTDHPERRGKDFHAGTDRAAQGMNDGNGGERFRRYQEQLANPRGPVREYHLDGWKAPPTRPAIVADVFGGTGTTAMVARALDRIGISIDLSHSYSRAARWRVHHDAGKAISRTWVERQGTLPLIPGNPFRDFMASRTEDDA
jgi:SAM-dependent methyltransferase